MRKILSLVAVASTVALLVGTANASAPKKVFEDVTGDADMAQGLGASIPGGFDLVEGSIARNGDNLEFTATMAELPPINTLPEAFRFMWSFTVDGHNYRLTVKSADIGKPDVLAGQTTERVGRVDVAGHFRLEDECSADSTLPVTMVNCPPLEYLEGTWDTAASSFTVIVPLASIDAKPKSKIAGGTGQSITGCQICWITHSAERSLNTTIIDNAAMIGTYKVPKK